MRHKKLQIAQAALAAALVLLSCTAAPPRAPATELPGGSTYMLTDSLPLAPELIKKTLANGFTYYVRKNGNPGRRAVMFLIVNTGSANERSDQAGYAHFVEHMAFNGTKSFPENELVNYLRSIGMEFGAEVNAHTTREETLYTLQMPVSKPEFFDTGLTVLKEWAKDIQFDPAEVENEKGIILEEMRANRGANERARVQEIRGLLSGSSQADKETLGTEASVKTATAAGLKAFYDEHYRPDRMAVIVVGDIDPQKVSKQIEDLFSFPSSDGTVKERPLFAVRPTMDMGFSASFDAEFDRSLVSYRKIVPYLPETTIGGYQDMVAVRISAMALQFRLNDVSRSAEVPWDEAAFSDDYFFGRTRLYSFGLSMANGKELEAFSALAREVERVRRFGFTHSEFNRAADSYRRWLGTLDVEDQDLQSWSFAEEYVRNFMYGEPVPGVVRERIYIKEVLDTLSVERLNAAINTILATDEGFVAVRAKKGPSNAGIHEAAFEKALRNARKAELEAIANVAESGSLFDNVPDGASIVSEKQLLSGITEIILSNGARVLLKPTKYDKDSVGFIAWSRGGYMSLPPAMQTNAVFMPSLLLSSGLGNMNATRLDEALAAKNIALQWSISETAELLYGKSSTAELETLLRLIYLFAAEPGRDALAFNAARNKLAAQLETALTMPQYRFETAWTKDIFSNNPRMDKFSVDDLKAVSFGSTRELALSLYNNAADFVYVFVGDFDIARLKALAAKYIGAITKGKEPPAQTKWIEAPVLRASDERSAAGIRFKFANERRASVKVIWGGQAPWSQEREATLQYLAQAFNNCLLDKLREKMGATYVVSTQATFSKTPSEQYMLQVIFDTDPDRVKELTDIVQSTAADMAAGKFDEKYVQQIKAAALQNLSGRTRTNDFWIANILSALENNTSLDILNISKTMMRQIDGAVFEALAKELLTRQRCFVYTMTN